MSPLKFKCLWFFIGYSLVVLVIVLSLSPSLPQPVSFPSADKVLHVLAYGVLMLWFAQLHPKSRYGWLVCGLIALGILLEIVQLQSGIRSGEVWDAAANSFGVILSWRLALMGMNTLLYQFEDWYLKPDNKI